MGVVVDYFYGSPERTAPIVDYEVNGVRYTYHHPTATLTNSRNHPIGSQIEVVYWPQNPELANLKEVVDNKLIDAVFFFVSFLFLLIPSLLYAMDYRRYHSRQE